MWIRARFWIGSIALHLIVGAVVLGFTRRFETEPAKVAIEIVEAPLHGSVPGFVSAPAPVPGFAPSRRRAPKLSLSSPSPPSVATARRSIDLFSPDALAVVAPRSESAPAPARFGGTTRRLGDGLPDPSLRDSSADREEAAARIHSFFEHDRAIERARTGDVAPAWRDAERRIDRTFSPSVATITDDGRAETFAKQLLNRFTAPLPTAPATGRADNPAKEDLAMAQTLAMQAALGDPAEWLRSEIEVVVDAIGRIVSSRVVRRSGRKRFDQEAMKSVVAAIQDGRLSSESTIVTLWSLEAAVAVTPIAPLPMVGFTRNGFDYPLKKTVHKRVRLIAIVPRG